MRDSDVLKNDFEITSPTLKLVGIMPRSCYPPTTMLEKSPLRRYQTAMGCCRGMRSAAIGAGDCPDVFLKFPEHDLGLVAMMTFRGGELKGAGALPMPR